MDNEGDDDYSWYNIVSKRKSIEQNSDGSSSNNNKKNHVGENEDINHDATVVTLVVIEVVEVVVLTELEV